MDLNFLRRFDLNLLLVFETLMEMGSATRTAERLARTQPGVSRDLAKLRRHTGDPLFVKVRGRLEPTDFALKLHPTIRHALDTIEQGLTNSGEFKPAEVNHVFQIAANSSIELILASQLYNMLRKAAPGIVTCFSTIYGDVLPLEDLDMGRLHLALGRFKKCPEHLAIQPLFRDRRVCVVRQGHPIGDRPLSLKRLASLQFLTTSNMLGRDNDLDELLQAQGYHRQFPLLISNFAVAPHILLTSDIATTLPERAAKYLAAQFPLKCLPLPSTMPSNTFSMVWHKRWQASPPHVWLRQQVINLLADKQVPSQI
jgi:DNA-binding transcriptional LysR family regulator